MKIVEDLDSRSVGMETAPTASANGSPLYVQYIGHYYANPKYSIERERLDSFLLAYTLRGKGELTYRDKVYPLGKGTAFMIDCREYHRYRNIADDIWEFAWVHFHGRMAEDYVQPFMKYGGPVTDAEAAQGADQIRAIMQAMKQVDERSGLLGSLQLIGLVNGLLLQAMRGKLQEERVPAYIAQAKMSLERRLRESFRLDDWAREFSLSKYHLSREFKRYTGYSPYEYLLNVRLRAAKDLLRTTALTVEEIARQAGFSNATQFIHMFKQKESMTPLQFRKAWRGL